MPRHAGVCFTFTADVPGSALPGTRGGVSSNAPRASYIRSSASGRGERNDLTNNGVRFQSKKWLLFVHKNAVSRSKTGVIFNLIFFLQFSEMTLR